MGKLTFKIFIFLLIEAAIGYISGVMAQLYASSMRWTEKGMVGHMNLSFSTDIKHVSRILFTGTGLLTWLILSAMVIVAYVFLKYSYGTATDERGIKYAENGTYGTSGWMKDKVRNAIFEVSGIRKNSGIILGRIGRKAVSLPVNTVYNKHIAVFGASGSGKSRKFVRTNILQMAKLGQSMILTDPKGELYRDMAEMLGRWGYTVKLFNLVEPTHSDRWNVLNDVTDDLTAQTFSEVVISNTKLGSGKSAGDPFWDRAEQNLLKALTLYVVNECPVENRNMGFLYSLLACGDSDKVDIIFEKLPADHPAKAPYNIYKQASDNVRTGVVIGLGTRLQVFQNKMIRSVTAMSDIDLEEPGRSKCAYFCIMSDVDTTLDYLASLFFSFLFIKLVRHADRTGGRCNPEVYFILDEFPNIGQIPDFTKKISTVRSRGINCFIVFQNIAQLKNRYPNDAWQEIIGNCDTKLFLGCTDNMTATFVSDIIGVATIKDYNYTKKLGFEGLFDYGRETAKENKRNLLNPDEVLRLPDEEELVIIRGQKTLKLRKVDYTSHYLAKHIIPRPISMYVPDWVFEMQGNTGGGKKAKRIFTAPSEPVNKGDELNGDGISGRNMKGFKNFPLQQETSKKRTSNKYPVVDKGEETEDAIRSAIPVQINQDMEIKGGVVKKNPLHSSMFTKQERS
jgi:type IV secretion system protein VirD4